MKYTKTTIHTAIATISGAEQLPELRDELRGLLVEDLILLGDGRCTRWLRQEWKLAIDCENMPVLEWLAEVGVKGESPDMVTAITAGKDNVIAFLLRHGAMLGAETRWDQNPLGHALDRGMEQLVEELVRHGARIALLVPFSRLAERPTHPLMGRGNRQVACPDPLREQLLRRFYPAHVTKAYTTRRRYAVGRTVISPEASNIPLTDLIAHREFDCQARAARDQSTAWASMKTAIAQL